jgi:hypothetical protein
MSYRNEYVGILTGFGVPGDSMAGRHPASVDGSECMGVIWDLIQHNQISATQQRATSLEQRVEMLEAELVRTNETLMTLLKLLERRFGEDLDRDGRVG